MSNADRPIEIRRQRSEPPPEVVDLEHPVHVDRLYGMRAALAAHASRLGAGSEQIENLLIVAGELASNAIRHGGGSGLLKLWRRNSQLYCQVSDEGPGISDPTIGSTPPDLTSTNGSGHGLWICRNLATELVIETGPDGRGTTITAVLPIM